MSADNLKEAIPDLYSYITVRAENFGGFLFNPYLSGEVSLDQREYRVLELCNGRLTAPEISAMISKEFLLDKAKAETFVSEALKKFNGNYAINWRQEKKAGKAVTPIPVKGPLKAVTDNYIDHYSAPLSVIFELTHECNLKCPHCLVSAGKSEENELSTREVKDVLDQLSGMKVFNVNFGGGEPLLRKDILEILTYASDLNLGIIISTNGLLVNDTFLDSIDDLKAFSVQVSVDGLEQTHDNFRGMKGSFKKATEALKAFSVRGYQATMSTMILRGNIGEMRALMDLCVSLGVSSFKLSSYMPAGRGVETSGEHMISKQELKEFARYIGELKEEFREKLFVDDKATYSFVGNTDICVEPNSMGNHNYRIGCSAARSNLVISPVGEVYACPFFLVRSAGNLRDSKLRLMWDEAEIFKVFRSLNSEELQGNCKNCEHIPYNCQGGCRAAAFLSSGDFYGEDPFCWYKI